MLSVDIINKHYDESTGVLKATRLIMLKSWVPSWLQPLVRTNVCFFLEDSITDPHNKRLVLKGLNLTLANLAEMHETCVYTEDPLGGYVILHICSLIWPHWIECNIFSNVCYDRTRFEQEGAVTAYTWGLARRLERFCLDRFRSAATQGRDIMEQTIRRVKEEAFPIGITHSVEKALLPSSLPCQLSLPKIDIK